MPGLSNPFPSLPIPNKEGVFHDESPQKIDPPRQELPTPTIRILAPTPEGEEHRGEPLAVRLATLALNSHGGTSARNDDSSAPPSRPQAWTDELVKQPPASRASYFLEDFDSDEQQDSTEEDTSESDDTASSGSEHEWSTELSYTRTAPPRTPSPTETIRPSHARCDCKATTVGEDHTSSADANEGVSIACDKCKLDGSCLIQPCTREVIQKDTTDDVGVN
ncbi:hypothetical protein G7054_g13514 [Neopestalotiopsis clavispora]|nr:hypothetical protein G7054_g13514 [Neopestalotiopsis clavispora]